MIRIKICGITNAADALAAIDAGANLLGFNFYAKSPRHITEAEAAKIRPQLPNKIKAVRVEPDFRLGPLDESPEAFAYLFDAANTGQYGGTGRTTDWDVARRAAVGRRIILAGGLNAENVAAAVRIVRPYAVDVASGVESKPGKKEHARLRELIREVRRGERK